MRSRLSIVSTLLWLAACGGASPPAAGVVAAPAATEAPPASGSADAGAPAALTAEECERQGGHVVGDIGDGATHRPDYRCPDSGQPPIGRIAVEPGKPIPIEGAVCCR